MKKKFLSLFVLSLCMLVFMASGFSQAQDDGRVNLVGHFGGDSIYCDDSEGCTMLNTNGEFLWNVPQSLIDETFEAACQAGISFEIEAGMGTHGPSIIVISCYEGYEPALKLKAFDEHGKVNQIQFPRDYSPAMPAVAPQATEEPVTPTPSPEPTLCPHEVGPCEPTTTPTPEPTLCPHGAGPCDPTPPPTEEPICPGVIDGPCAPICPTDPTGPCDPTPPPTEEPTEEPICPSTPEDPCYPEPPVCPYVIGPCEPIDDCDVSPLSALKPQC